MYKQPDQGFKIEKNGGTKNKIEKNKSDARVAGTFIKYKKNALQNITSYKHGT